MSKDGITGQKRMATAFGAPAAGKLWCSGFERDPHQVAVDQFYPKSCRCKACRHKSDEQYRSLAPRRVDSRAYRAHRESDDRYVEAGRVPPGNNGLPVPMPAWGYVPPERRHDASYYDPERMA